MVFPVIHKGDGKTRADGKAFHASFALAIKFGKAFNGISLHLDGAFCTNRAAGVAGDFLFAVNYREDSVFVSKGINS